MLLSELRMCVHALAFAAHTCVRAGSLCATAWDHLHRKNKLSDESFLDILHPNLKIYLCLHPSFPLSLTKNHMFLLFLFRSLSLLFPNYRFIPCPLSASFLYFFLLLESDLLKELSVFIVPIFFLPSCT